MLTKLLLLDWMIRCNEMVRYMELIVSYKTYFETGMESIIIDEKIPSNFKLNVCTLSFSAIIARGGSYGQNQSLQHHCVLNIVHV